MYFQRLRHVLSDLDKLTKKLKYHEQQIEQYGIDFNPIYAGIEESRTQCQTKLALMEMFKWKGRRRKESRQRARQFLLEANVLKAERDYTHQPDAH